MNSRVVLACFIAVAMLGLGATAYLAMSKEKAIVFSEEVGISPSSYSIKMNASSVYTRNITVSTNDAREITVRIKVMPGNYETSDSWGDGFFAFASPSEVKVSKGKPAKVSIIHYAEKPGSYEVKIVAVK